MDVQKVLEGVHNIQAQVLNGGRPAERPGYLAMGQLLRMIGDEKGAWENFQKAFDRGNPISETRLHLAGGQLRLFALGVSELIDNPKRGQVKSTLDALAEKHLVPAKALLANVTNQLKPEFQPVARILIAAVDLDLSKAIEEAQTFRKENPDSFRACLLEAQTRLFALQAKHLGEHGMPRLEQGFDPNANSRELASLLASAESQMPSAREWALIKAKLNHSIIAK
jgi:hypothetical protein